MQLPALLLKTTVVLLFFLLVACFVTYRAGAFDPFFFKKTQPVNLVVENNLWPVAPYDSVPPVQLIKTEMPTILSSSKYIIVSDKSLFKYMLPDSIWRKIKNDKTLYHPAVSRPQKRGLISLDSIYMMSGSKSGPIIGPRSFVIIMDSITRKIKNQ